MSGIDPKGFWIGKETTEHCFDPFLAYALVTFFRKEKASSVVDFGCGLGEYVEYLLRYGIPSEGYDGNPDTPELTHGLGKIQDLSVSFDLGKKFDWVLCLEVGEHIPKEYETTFIENLIHHCRHGIVLSWALPNQGGYGHVNEQENAAIKKRLAQYQFVNDIDTEQFLRAQALLPWFKKTTMVFRPAGSYTLSTLN